MRTVTSVVLLEVKQDVEAKELARPWWEILGLPAPEYWDEQTAPDTMARVRASYAIDKPAVG